MKPGPARILIVDDERHNRQLLQVVLAQEGFDLVSAASGKDALDLVAKQPPDLVLLDIMMPGMDGYMVVEAIKGNGSTRNIPVIIVTDLDDRHARMRALEIGAEDFLTKPVDRAELCLRVRNLLRLKEHADFHDKYSQMLEGEVGSRTAKLIESERLYRSTFDTAPVGIVHLGLDGQWLQVNQRMCELLKFAREELRVIQIRDLMEPEAAAAEAELFRQMIAGTLDRHVVDELRLRRQDGGFVWARVNTSVHRDADGRAQHVISVVEDITERRTLDAQLRQASKMDAIGQLASGVAHDFNNLLTVILGFAEIVAADAEMVVRHGKDLGEIVLAAERAAGLTRQLLAFSRQQVLHAEPLDMNTLITDMTGMLGRLIGEHIAVTLILKADLCLVLADRGQLEQVVMNLVVNARDAMPDGGTVTIETTEVELENSVFHEEAIVPGAYVMLAVTDTGQGISREIRRRLFEPFFTTKETGKGTGLGLSTTYGIVKQSKGYIWVYSEVGHGTTFKVYLPRATGVAAEAAPPPGAVPPRQGTAETVLLVEDEEALRGLVGRILEKAGYAVLEARDGHDGERMYHLHAATIDIVVTDVVMPGIGGPELVSRLLLANPALRFLYMSGYSEQSLIRMTDLDRSRPIVQKPFTAADLLSRLREALDRSAPPG